MGKDMRVLVAEDDAVSRRMMQLLLERWGYEAIVAEDGQKALDVLTGDNPPRLVLLDWMMPGLDGIELCKRIRSRQEGDEFYVVMVTAREDKRDVVAGLECGADDYVVKPFDQAELRSRLKAGERIIGLTVELKQKIGELEEAMGHVKQLQGIIPICIHCHRIRDEKRIWQRLERYIQEHSNAVFSHALCDECLHKYYPEAVEEEAEGS
ncbi:MAG: DNA-binding response regulator [Deltaproteobacteria bacterium]|nr:MAG: DNA-binding response regulator [Deltaproteobacteria bacterium]